MINLSINVNKIATLRNARGGSEPDVLKAAKTCIESGCHGITVHPREDERHIRNQDVYDIDNFLKKNGNRIVEYNIEGDPRPGLVDMVLNIMPDQFTLVPVEPGEVTSHHGWDIDKNAEILEPIIKRCKDKGIRISLFMDAVPENMKKAAKVGADRVELYTGPYAEAFKKGDYENEFSKLKNSHDAAIEAGIELNAGHDIDIYNLEPVREKLLGIKEASIGHAFICHALYVGLKTAARDFLKACGHI
jgi:pyridoxine 5-phosphate synthase